MVRVFSKILDFMKLPDNVYENDDYDDEIADEETVEAEELEEYEVDDEYDDYDEYEEDEIEENQEEEETYLPGRIRREQNKK